MNILLTPQQLPALDAREDGVPRVIDPRNNEAYVLVREAEYATIRDALEDEERHRGISATALKNAIGRMDEKP